MNGNIPRGTMKRTRLPEPDLKLLLNIALPMIISQASETIMMFSDRLFLSWLGKNHISAAMSGGLSAFAFNSFFIGIIGYTNALAGQYFGAGREKQCLQSTTQGIYLSIAFYPLIFLLVPAVKYIFITAGHTENQITLEYQYFSILMAGSIFMLIRNALAGFFLGIGETRIVMTANIAGMIVNVPLNYILIFGKLGFPALGLAGAALGTIGGSFFIALILLISYMRHRIYREHRNGRIWNYSSTIMKKLLRFGLPSGAELFLNVFAFNLFLQLMHSISEDVAAAVTITFNYDMIAFIPMLGLGIAVTAMTAQQMGAGNIEGARKAAFLALKTGYAYAFVMMLVFIVGAEVLVSFFSRGLSGNEAELTALAAGMVRLAAVYTAADVTQLVFGGALRGAGDTKFVMYISVILHWIMAMGALVLIKFIHASPMTVWIFFIGFVVCLGGAIFLRFNRGTWKRIKVIDERTDMMHVPSEQHIQ